MTCTNKIYEIEVTNVRLHVLCLAT